MRFICMLYYVDYVLCSCLPFDKPCKFGDIILVLVVYTLIKNLILSRYATISGIPLIAFLGEQNGFYIGSFNGLFCGLW